MNFFVPTVLPLSRALIVAAALGLVASPLAAQANTHVGHGPAAAAKPSASLPTPGQIIDKYLAAIGGREALMKHSASITRGTFEVPAAGLRAELLSKAAKPNKVSMLMTIPGMGEIRSGYDGTTGWAIEPASGPRVLEGVELTQTQMQAEFPAVLRDVRNYSSMETVELADFGGSKAYLLRLIRAGVDTTYEYFDAETGLLVGVRATRDTQMGPMTATTVMSDYTDFGGVRMPSTLKTRMAGQEIVMSLTSVEWDTVEPTAFELPPEIKVLVTK